MIGLGGLVLIPVLALAYFGRVPAPPRAVAPAPVPVPVPAAAVRPAPAAVAQPEPSPAPAAAAQAPSFDVVRVGASGSAVIAGRAAPGAEVILMLDGGREIGRARADRRGEWVILPPQIAPGAWELSLRARQGEVETGGTDSVVVMVPEPARPAASATAPAPASAPAAGAFAVLMPPSAPPRLLQAPAAEAAAEPGLAIGSVEHGAGTAMRVSGTAPPGAVLRLHLDGRHLGETTADAEGRWQFAAPAATGEGTVRVERVGADGRVAMRAEAPFAPAAAPGPGRRVVVERGTNLWRIARMNYGQGLRYTVIYEANRGQVRDPGRIYPGQVLEVPERQATPASSSESR